MNPDNDTNFDVSRAELFEALGHSTRIRILQALSETPLAFSEMKKRTGIQSSGLLSFHLGKLTNLVTVTKEGTYTLTDQGREALRMVQITRSEGIEPSIRVKSPERRQYLAVIIVLLLALASLSSIAAYQAYRPAETRIMTSVSFSTTTVSVTPTSTPTVIVTGFLSFNFSGMPDSRVELVNFTAYPGSNVYPPPAQKVFSARVDSTGQYWVAIPASMDIVAYSVSFRSTVPCLHQCPAVHSNNPPPFNVTFTGPTYPYDSSVSGFCDISPVTHLCSPMPSSQFSIAWSGYTNQANQTGYAMGGCSSEFFLYVGSKAPAVVQNFNCP